MRRRLPKEPSDDLAYDNGPQVGKSVDGLLKRGNVDVNHRPDIKNDDGSHSSINSMTVPLGKDGHSLPWGDKGIVSYALVPSIADGKFLTPNGKMPKKGDEKANQALEDKATEYYDKTREHLGIFKTDTAANKYAGKTHAWGNDGTSKKIYHPSY